jgi:biopolymer transport protein ExbB
MLIDYLFETISSGGLVLIPILLVGAAGFFLVGLALLEMKSEIFRYNYKKFNRAIFRKLTQNDISGVRTLLKKKPGLIANSLTIALDNNHLEESALRTLLDEKLGRTLLSLDRHLPMIAVTAAVAPLLGLLGTVTGMVHTFQIITEYGNSNPVLMARGISEALITTQSGLLIAFPLVLFRHQLDERINWLKKQVELVITHYLNHRYHYNGNSDKGDSHGIV